MARLINPIIEQKGYFDTVTIDRNRLFSQLIDNLNKSAVVGFSHTELGKRLKSAWHGDQTQLRMYDDVQDSVNIFRAYCLEHNLLDFSLTMELFIQRLWSLPQCRAFLTNQYKHIIIDNLEEDTPSAHIVMADLAEASKSALLIYDTNAGYRRFLGADAFSGRAIRRVCNEHVLFEDSFVTNQDLEAFSQQLAISLNRLPPDYEINTDPRSVLIYDDHRYHPQMVDWVTDEIANLVHNHGVQPSEMVILSPYLSDALRFSIMNRLQDLDVPVRSHRPSRSLREEPATLTMLTLTQLAHPQWYLPPTPFDVIYALMMAIDGLDLVRAQLLGRGVYRIEGGQPKLETFDQLPPATQERITFTYGNRYDQLREWIETQITNTDLANPDPLDHFLSRLFGEVLSQTGFGFHTELATIKDTAEIAANLIESARRFRWVIGESGAPVPENKSLAQEYVEMVNQGIIADQYVRRWETQFENAVLVAPAYTFLMSNRPVDYQFWLNVGGRGWAERLYQPLTNPYVLSKNWVDGEKWSDMHDVEASEESLYKLSLGLINRCRKNIYLGYSELGEQGYEQRGALLDAIQKMLRRLQL